jgi:lipopolysaccharide transport system ATP-binding protein
MTRAEIRKRFDEIVAFAEIDRFLDTPVKRYSSGMYMRLAFAVAAHMEPEILVVDEVLAVGDAEFQKRCLGKMEEVAGGGRTVLFVSHNMGAMQQLCRSAIWLEQGLIKEKGSTATILRSYLADVVDHQSIIFERRNAATTSPLTLQSARLSHATTVMHGEPLEIAIAFEVRTAAKSVVFGIGLNGPSGSRILSCDSDLVGPVLYDFKRPGRYAVMVRIPSLPLSPERYTLDIGCRTQAGIMIDEVKSVGILDILPGPRTPPQLYRQYATVCQPGDWCVPPPADDYTQTISA